MLAAKPFSWSFATIKNLFASAYADWSADEVPRMGAALAYYSLLSIAPLLLIATSIAGFAFGRQSAQEQILLELRSIAGRSAAETIEGMLRAASEAKSSGIIASVLGIVALLFAASTLVAELRWDLDKIWKISERANGGFASGLKEKAYTFLLVMGIGVLLLASIVVNTILTAAGKYFEQALPMPESVLQILNHLITLAVVTMLFAVTFKLLPKVRLKWSDVWGGAAFTAILFAIGNYLIGLYLGRAGFASTFGAAGSLVLLLVWIFYSSQIFFFGAELTRVYAKEHGSDHGARVHEQRKKAAASAGPGNAAVPPTPLAGHRQKIENATFAGNLGAIIGLTVDTGKRIVRVIKS